MSDKASTKFGHTWRWQDEDPEAIVILVLILVAIIALPWQGCGPASARGTGHSVIEMARPTPPGAEAPALPGDAEE